MSGLASFTLSYEISPIIFVGGVAADLPDGKAPIISFTESEDFEQGVTGESSGRSVEDYFAHFLPMAGGTLIDNQVGTYPFANQSVAANAIVTQPLRIALQMIVPARARFPFDRRKAIMTALQKTVSKHVIQGGTFTVATPVFLYTDCLLVGLRDAGSQGHQAQNVWQWDFMQPLLTLEAARQAQNAQMAKISKGVQLSGDPPSGALAASIGEGNAMAAPSTTPAAKNTVGSSVHGHGGP